MITRKNEVVVFNNSVYESGSVAYPVVCLMKCNIMPCDQCDKMINKIGCVGRIFDNLIYLKKIW